jgi:hypothetical protein
VSLFSIFSPRHSGNGLCENLSEFPPRKEPLFFAITGGVDAPFQH